MLLSMDEISEQRRSENRIAETTERNGGFCRAILHSMLMNGQISEFCHIAVGLGQGVIVP